MKRLAINASILDDRPTGLGVYTINLIIRLADILCSKGEVEITVFSPVKIAINKDVIIKTIPGIVTPRNGKLGAISRFIWNQLFFTFIGKGFDLVYCTTAHTSIFLTNQIITVHDLISMSISGINFLQRTYNQFFLRKSIDSSIKTISISDFTKTEILRYFNVDGSKIEVVHNGIDQNLLNPDLSIIKHKENFLIAVGPTLPHKNFVRLINAYAKINSELREKNKLIIIGGYNKYVKKLKSIVDDLGISSNVEFTGYVDGETIIRYYKTSSLMIFPSLHEGFGLPPIEAMVCGCPVLASDIPSIREVCGDAIIYMDPKSEPSIQEALERILNDANLRQEKAKEGIIRAQRFSWDLTARKISTVIFNSLYK